MGRDEKRLNRALRSLRSRAAAVRWVRWSGRYFLGLAVLTLLLVLVREYVRLTRGVEIVPLSIREVLAAALGAVLLLPLLLRGWLRLGRPDLESVARHVDFATGRFDLLPAGLAAIRARGALAPAVVRRAAAAAEGIRAEAVYPAVRPVARTFAKLVVLLAAIYLLGLPAGPGWIPVPGGGGEGGAPARPREDPGLPPESDQRAEGKRPGGTEEPDETDPITVRLIPAKSVYQADEPVVVFITAEAGETMSRTHEAEVHAMVGDVGESLGERISVRPGQGELLSADLRGYRRLGPRLVPGRHLLRAVLVEEGVAHASEPVEIEVLGPPSGGGGGGTGSEPPPEQEEPEPGGGAGDPPPPKARPEPKFVEPLFREGDTVKKEGWALVSDPDAPPGTPPRRLPIAEAMREAARRPETPVVSERLDPADRSTVSRYFDRLRGSR